MVGPKKVLLLCEGRAWYVEPSRALPLVGPNARPRPCGARAPRPGDIWPVFCLPRPGVVLTPSEKITLRPDGTALSSNMLHGALPRASPVPDVSTSTESQARPLPLAWSVSCSRSASCLVVLFLLFFPVFVDIGKVLATSHPSWPCTAKTKNEAQNPNDS